MRTIVNISLPKELNQEVNNIIKGGQYATKSEFFREILRMWLEGKILRGLIESRKELMSRNGKLLYSLKDLR